MCIIPINKENVELYEYHHDSRLERERETEREGGGGGGGRETDRQTDRD